MIYMLIQMNLFAMHINSWRNASVSTVLHSSQNIYHLCPFAKLFGSIQFPSLVDISPKDEFVIIQVP